MILELLKDKRSVVVAEITNNHHGDVNRLLEMVELCKRAGADIIKLQKRDVDTFYAKEKLESEYKSPFGNTLGDYRRAVELSKDGFLACDDLCKQLDIPWFASILDWNSLKFMMQFNTPLVKLPSTISNKREYLLKVSKEYKGDLVISTGYTDVYYEEFILQNFTKDRNLVLMQCTSSYPTPSSECNIGVIRHYDKLRMTYPNIIPGYSSHDDGSLGCQMAVAAGARVIEKHVKLGDTEWVHFDGVALDISTDAFKNFCDDIKLANTIHGSESKTISSYEHHKY